jgi:hypothetical protein
MTTRGRLLLKRANASRPSGEWNRATYPKADDGSGFAPSSAKRRQRNPRWYTSAIAEQSEPVDRSNLSRSDGKAAVHACSGMTWRGAWRRLCAQDRSEDHAREPSANGPSHALAHQQARAST